MSNAPVRGKLTSLGHVRNGPWFWNKMLEKYPEFFSPDNIALIKLGKSPYVDDVWLKYNPTQISYKGDKLIHHHVEQGAKATGVPEKLHRGMFDLLHPYKGEK